MLQRLLIDKMENRILVGITMFVGIMILVGWVAINENGRMASFERQHTARAVERGALLFTANCAECHGEDGRGIENFGPALNSPHFFGYNYFQEIDDQLRTLEQEEAALNAELEAIREEVLDPETTEARLDELEEQRAAITEALNGEDGLVIRRAGLLEEQQALMETLQPAVDKGYPISSDVDADGNEFLVIDYSRLAQVDWQGTREDYIITTLIHGRPTSISYWDGNQMVAWSQRAGGPLRDDQIGDLAQYILNWDRGDDWTLEDALAVNQYAKVPGMGGSDAGPALPPAGTDVLAILDQIESGTVVGDPVRGQAIYNNDEPSGRNSRLGCAGCHAGAVAAPDTEMQWDSILTERLEVAQFDGYTPEQYIIESIIDPGAYVVPGWSNAMPGDFSTRTTVQDLADIIAYIHTYSELDPYEPPPPAEEEPAAEDEGGES